MRDPRSPSLRLRRLAAEIRRLRETSGQTVTEVAKQLGWSHAKLSKMETTETKRIKQGDLERLMDFYRVSEPEVRVAMLALAKDAQVRGWWTKYKDVFKNETLPDFETEASAIRTYESQVIPGLLQVPEYTRAIFQGDRYISDEDVSRRVEARMARREILNRHVPLRLRTVIDEAAFHRLIGGYEVMSWQVRHLLHMAQMPHIDVQVLPFGKGAHAGLTAPFIILDFPNTMDSAIVCVPTLTDALYLEMAEEIEQYNVAFGDVQGSALSAAESAEFMTERLASWENEQWPTV